MPKTKETVGWKAQWRVDKYHGDLPTGKDRKDHKPYEVIEREGNLLLREGIGEMWDLITGVGGTAYSEANARIGVGNGNAVAVDTQTALQGGSTAFKAMESGYPTSAESPDVSAIFRSSFASGEGNFAWEEWSIDNGSSPNKNLNRKAESLGTKVSGTTWVFTVTLTLS